MIRLPSLLVTTLSAGLLILTACDSEPAPSASTPSVSSGSTSPTADPDPTRSRADVFQTFPVGNRELFLACVGTASPTVVLESGDGVPSQVMHHALAPTLSQKVRVCSYDRANTGRSDSGAPLPRQSREILADLSGLLESARIPAPYVLVGHSAGGMIVQSCARNYPDSVAGVVAMNPVPPWRVWRERAFPEMTEAERRAETAYFDGEGSTEGFDFREISDQYSALDEPDGIPFHMLISTAAQCESPNDVCERTYPAYVAAMEQISRSWPEGRFTQTASQHEIYFGDLDAVLAAVNDVLARGTRD